MLIYPFTAFRFFFFLGGTKTTISRYFNHPDSLTLENQEKISQALDTLGYKKNKLAKVGIKDYIGVELTMNSIRKDSILCNPGILGSGILATNLSQISKDTILDYRNKLE